jgi:hypothetical protein
VFSQEVLIDVDIPVRNGVFGLRSGTFPQTRFLQKLASGWAVDGDFSLRAAAGRANVCRKPRAMPAGTLLLTQLAGSVHRR